MQYFSAEYIFPVSSKPIKKGIVVTDAAGYILDVLPAGSVSEPSQVKQFKGIICPGFVNTHCHLELSYLQGKIPEKQGIDEFIRVLEQERNNTTPAKIQQAIEDAEKQMIKNGIVAVGDISNGSHSFRQKMGKKIHYHTFIEVFSFHPDKAEAAFEKAKKLYDVYLSEVDETPGHISLSPHAPYSVSEKLLEMIAEHAGRWGYPVTMHNQESEEENNFFISKKGKLVERLNSFGIDTDFWQPPGQSSLTYMLPHMPQENKLLLVHNTVTCKEEIAWAQKRKKNIYWCTCPNANLYIENRLPDYVSFIEAGASMTIGTDSLASNHSLSILEEMKSISRQVSFLTFDKLLSWATLNGAEFLGINDRYGSIEKGKQPGLLNIVNFGKDFAMGDKTSVVRIV